MAPSTAVLMSRVPWSYTPPGCSRPFLAAKQKTAEQLTATFTPRTRLGIRLRNLVTRAMGSSFIADLALGSSLRDPLVLPEYAVPSKEWTYGSKAR